MKHYRQFTLGTLVEYLDTLPPEKDLGISTIFDSYRGYYEHVYFSEGEATAKEISAEIERRLGSTMTGYKGGTFPVEGTCRVFLTSYGDTGPMLIGFTDEGEPITCDEPDLW